MQHILWTAPFPWDTLGSGYAGTVSCWTGYLLRAADGTVRVAALKYGSLLQFDRALGRPLEQVRDGWFDDWLCRGVAVDEPGRRFRCYPCEGNDRFLATGLAAREAWPGWDADVAIGGREEFAELLPETARVIRPYRIGTRYLTPLPHDDRWFVGWDPVAFALTVREHEYSADWFGGLEHDLVTVVTAEAAAYEYRLETVHGTIPVHPLLSWLQRGPAATGGLLVPFPPGDETFIRTAVLVDYRRRVLEFRPTDLAPPRLVRAVEEAWPGWHVQMGSAKAGDDVRRPTIRVLD
jgi:hypothetical protein